MAPVMLFREDRLYDYSDYSFSVRAKSRVSMVTGHWPVTAYKPIFCWPVCHVINDVALPLMSDDTIKVN